MLTTYVGTASLLQFQKVAPTVRWRAAKSMLYQWSVFLPVLRGPTEKNRAVYGITLLIGAAEGMNARLQAQSQHQPTMPAALVRFIQTDFNKSCRQLFTAVRESTSQSIFFFTIFLVLEKKYFFLPSPFFRFTSTGCSIPFRVFIKHDFMEPEAIHGL